MEIDWAKIKFFTPLEFACKCGCGLCNIRPELLQRLEKARATSDVPFSISSGSRCAKHNKKEGGTATSSHLTGWAVDIRYKNGAQAVALLKALLPHFNRIGVGKSFIHVDIDPGKSSPTLWTY